MRLLALQLSCNMDLWDNIHDPEIEENRFYGFGHRRIGAKIVGINRSSQKCIYFCVL